MVKVKKWFLEEFVWGYSSFEHIFMISLLALQIIVFILQPDSILGVVSGISGVISVVLCAKAKLSFYYIGFIQNISYLILAFQNHFYGEVIENIYYLVTMVIGIFLWKRNMVINTDGSRQVSTKKFNLKQWMLAIIGTSIATLGTGYCLTLINNAQAYTDAATNVLALFAQILMIKRYKEQWIWWLAIDILCIKMWWVAGNWSMVAMYIAWTINCIYGWYTWNSIGNTQQTNRRKVNKCV